MHPIAPFSTTFGKAKPHRHAPTRSSPLAAPPQSLADISSRDDPQPPLSSEPAPSPPRRKYTTATDCPSPAKTRPARRRASDLRASSALLAQEINEEDEDEAGANIADVLAAFPPPPPPRPPAQKTMPTALRLPAPPRARVHPATALPFRPLAQNASRLPVAPGARLPSALAADETQRRRRRTAEMHRAADAQPVREC